jgi:hypothetical protein
MLLLKTLVLLEGLDVGDGSLGVHFHEAAVDQVLDFTFKMHVTSKSLLHDIILRELLRRVKHLLFRLELFRLDLCFTSSSLGTGFKHVIRVAVTRADGLVGSEDGVDLRVHLDAHFPVIEYLLVALIDPLVHPKLERLPDDGEDAVGDVLSRHLHGLLLGLWEDSHGIWILACEIQHGLDLQSFILRNMHVFDFRAKDPGPLLRQQIAQLPNSDGIVAWQVDVTGVREEMVDLLLVPDLRG